VIRRCVKKRSAACAPSTGARGFLYAADIRKKRAPRIPRGAVPGENMLREKFPSRVPPAACGTAAVSCLRAVDILPNIQPAGQ